MFKFSFTFWNYRTLATSVLWPDFLTQSHVIMRHSIVLAFFLWLRRIHFWHLFVEVTVTYGGILIFLLKDAPSRTLPTVLDSTSDVTISYVLSCEDQSRRYQ